VSCILIRQQRFISLLTGVARWM